MVVVAVVVDVVVVVGGGVGGVGWTDDWTDDWTDSSVVVVAVLVDDDTIGRYSKYDSPIPPPFPFVPSMIH